MAVIVRPEDFEDSGVVLASSDAGHNDAAIREIDAWAREHGFVRSREYRLNVRETADGRRYYDSACYRWTPEHERAARATVAQIRSQRERMPVSAPSDLLLRDAEPS